MTVPEHIIEFSPIFFLLEEKTEPTPTKIFFSKFVLAPIFEPPPTIQLLPIRTLCRIIVDVPTITKFPILVLLSMMEEFKIIEPLPIVVFFPNFTFFSISFRNLTFLLLNFFMIFSLAEMFPIAKKKIFFNFIVF